MASACGTVAKQKSVVLRSPKSHTTTRANISHEKAEQIRARIVCTPAEKRGAGVGLICAMTGLSKQALSHYVRTQTRTITSTTLSRRRRPRSLRESVNSHRRRLSIRFFAIAAAREKAAKNKMPSRDFALCGTRQGQLYPVAADGSRRLPQKAGENFNIEARKHTEIKIPSCNLVMTGFFQIIFLRSACFFLYT